MYIPAFLPCHKCFSGPTLERDEFNHPRAGCECGTIWISTWGEINKLNNFTDSEILRLNIAWNEAVMEMNGK